MCAAFWLSFNCVRLFTEVDQRLSDNPRVRPSERPAAQCALHRTAYQTDMYLVYRAYIELDWWWPIVIECGLNWYSKLIFFNLSFFCNLRMARELNCRMDIYKNAPFKHRGSDRANNNRISPNLFTSNRCVCIVSQDRADINFYKFPVVPLTTYIKPKRTVLFWF